MACSDKMHLILRIVNILSALLLIGFGIAGIIVMALTDLTDGKFFLFFSPIFMVIIGFLFLAAEFNVDCIIRHCGLMRSYLGRGIFNIFMSSSVFYYFSCGSNYDIVGWIAAILIFVLGVFYIIVHFCGGEAFRREEEQRQNKSTINDRLR